MKSIQSKILIVVIAGLMVITAAVSSIAVSMTHDVMHRDADRILQTATQREAAQINNVLGDVVKSCAIMKHYALVQVERASDLSDPAFREDYMAQAERMFGEVALNTKGAQGYFLRLDPTYAGGKGGFYMWVNEQGVPERMPLTDLTQYQPDDTRNVGWYYEAVRAGKGVWLDPYYFPGQTVEMISYVEPLYLDQNLIGVVGFDMDFSYLCRRIEDIRVYEHGYALLLARDGEHAYTEVLAEVEHDHGHDEENPHTETRAELKNGMYLELRADYKDIQKEIRPMLGKIVYAFLTVLFFAILYTIFVTRKIVKPLKQLTAAAQAIASGEEERIETDILVDSDDEVGSLSRVLNSTFAKIREYTAHINALAYQDALTGIKNTTAYTEAIKALNEDICTGDPKFGVLMADINNLKQTNDKFGHEVGDELIVCAAKILSGIFRASVIFRIGGDEFAILLLGEDYEQYHDRLKELDAACAAARVNAGGASVPVAIARGVARFDPAIDRTYEDVFAKADRAMYGNKEDQKSAALV